MRFDRSGWLVLATVACAFAQTAWADIDPVDISSLAAVATRDDILTSTYVWRNVPNHAFKPGEELLFVIKWGVVSAGDATLSLRDLEEMHGRTAYHLVSEAHSNSVVDAFYHVEDRHDIWIDQKALVTLRYEKRIHEGGYHLEQKNVLDQSHGRFYERAYRFDKKIYENSEGAMPPNSLDVLGSLYYIRTLPLAVNTSYTVDVVSNDKVYPLVIKVKRREKIKVPAGRFDCFVVEPQLRSSDVFVSKGKKLEVWMTADERHMPVRMRSEVAIGHVSADLLDYRDDKVIQ